jgi:archaellum component FlaD/FlaE
VRYAIHFDLLSRHVVAGQLFFQYLAFDCHNVFVQLALKLLEVWQAIGLVCMPVLDKLSQLLDGETSQNRISVAQFHLGASVLCGICV